MFGAHTHATTSRANGRAHDRGQTKLPDGARTNNYERKIMTRSTVRRAADAAAVLMLLALLVTVLFLVLFLLLLLPPLLLL